MFLIQYYPQVEHVQLQVQVQVQPAAYNKSYDKSSELILSTQIIFMLPPFQTYYIIYIYVKFRVNVRLSYMLVKAIMSIRYNKFINLLYRRHYAKETIKNSTNGD